MDDWAKARRFFIAARYKSTLESLKVYDAMVATNTYKPFIQDIRPGTVRGRWHVHSGGEREPNQWNCFDDDEREHYGQVIDHAIWLGCVVCATLRIPPMDGEDYPWGKAMLTRTRTFFKPTCWVVANPYKMVTDNRQLKRGR